MIGRRAAAAVLVVLTAALSGCAHAVQGTPTWPGARLEAALLTAADFPPGVQYDRIRETPGQADGGGWPACDAVQSGGLLGRAHPGDRGSAERGAGSAAEVRRVLRRRADGDDAGVLAARPRRAGRRGGPVRSVPDLLRPGVARHSDDHHPAADVASRCAGLPADHAAGRARGNSVYFSFENIGSGAVFAIAFPTPNPAITVKATLPQTFMDLVAKQAQRLEDR